METKIRLLLAIIFIIFFSHTLCSETKQNEQENNLEQVFTTNGISSEENEVNLNVNDNFLQDTEAPAEEKWQYLEWEEEYPEFVLNYEVVIETLEENTGKYTEINRLQTETNTPYIQVKPFLPPGNYRYKVITFNLIGIAVVESDWFEFRIVKAFLPEISNIAADVNHSSTLFLDEINNGIFNITGKNLFKEPKNGNEISYTTYALKNLKKKNTEPLIPQILELDDKNRRLKIQFNMKDLDVGTYNFIATDA